MQPGHYVTFIDDNDADADECTLQR